MMTTTHLELAPNPEILDFENDVVRIQRHPSYAVLETNEQTQIDDILKFARTSPDRLVYSRRLLAALYR